MSNPVLNDKQRHAMERAVHMDALTCFRLNRLIRNGGTVHQFFSVVSRLGDGVLWYSMMLAMPLFFGAHGFVITAAMLLTAALGVWIYRLIKKRSMRPRPFVSYRAIKQGARTLDQFSFPSGHTMHAVAFTVLLVPVIPILGFFLVPFAILTGLARVVLGLHYPSDVLMGALLGVANAILILTIFSGFL